MIEERLPGSFRILHALTLLFVYLSTYGYRDLTDLISVPFLQSPSGSHGTAPPVLFSPQFTLAVC